MIRVGIGNDIHRLKKGRPLLIGGIEVPCDKGEDAHSDGDVLVHAIIDAILGATGKGDIGTYFPSDDINFKDIDSTILLTTVLSEMKGRIINLDSIIEFEGCRLLPFIPRIRERIASLLSVDYELVSVKAKSNEKLGPIGRAEAIKATVVLLLETP